MIFASIGLLVVAGGLLTAGIAKSSTGFLALSLLCTAASGVLLIVAYAAARGATGLNTNRAAPAGAPPGSEAGLVRASRDLVPLEHRAEQRTRRIDRGHRQGHELDGGDVGAGFRKPRWCRRVPLFEGLRDLDDHARVMRVDEALLPLRVAEVDVD